MTFSDSPDHIRVDKVTSCFQCNRDLGEVSAIGVERRQVFELPPLQLEVSEHRGEIKHCPKCQAKNHATFLPGVDNRTQYGERVKSLAVYLNNYQMVPYQRISQLFEDLFGVAISAGTIYNANCCCYEQLENSEEAIKQTIINSDVANFDETGLYQSAKRIWLHSASTLEATYYFAHPKRSSAAMDEAGILPEFRGVAIHDHWQCYNKYNNCSHAFCNVHHLRELTRAYEQDNALWAKEMKQLLLEIKQSVDKAKSLGKSYLDAISKQSYRNQYRAILKEALSTYPNAPAQAHGKRGKPKQSKAKNLLDRLSKYQRETLRFMDDFRVPFDNNLAERDIRMIKVKQKISRCFRSEQGTAFFCRIRGFISTMRKQKKIFWNLLENLFNLYIYTLIRFGWLNSYNNFFIDKQKKIN